MGRAVGADGTYRRISRGEYIVTYYYILLEQECAVGAEAEREGRRVTGQRLRVVRPPRGEPQRVTCHMRKVAASVRCAHRAGNHSASPAI